MRILATISKHIKKNYVSHVTCHVSCVTCCVLPVTCHSRQQPQWQTLPLLTPPLFTAGWFAKTQKPDKLIKNANKSLKQQEPADAYCFGWRGIFSPKKFTQIICYSHGLHNFINTDSPPHTRNIFQFYLVLQVLMFDCSVLTKTTPMTSIQIACLGLEWFVFRGSWS